MLLLTQEGALQEKFPENLKADQDKTQKVTGKQQTQITIEREDNSGTELSIWDDRND